MNLEADDYVGKTTLLHLFGQVLSGKKTPLA